MDRLTEVLAQIIAADARIHFDANHHCLLIEEPINTGKKELQSVELKLSSGINPAYKFYFAFKLDHEECKFLGKLFRNDVEDIRKAVDAVVLCDYKSQPYIFLIELKSNVRSGFTRKIKSSKAFLVYLKAVLKAYYNLDLDDFNFKTKSIVFDRKVNKGRPKLEKLEGEEFYHQGFPQKNGIADIRNFINNS